MMVSLKSQAMWPSPRAQSAQTRLTFNYKTGWLTKRLERVLRLKPDTRVPVTDLSPRAIQQSSAESQTNTSLKRPMFHLVEFKLTVQKAWCFFISLTSPAAAARIPWAPFPPTSQDLLAWEVCQSVLEHTSYKTVPKMSCWRAGWKYWGIGYIVIYTCRASSQVEGVLILASRAWMGNKLKFFKYDFKSPTSANGIRIPNDRAWEWEFLRSNISKLLLHNKTL